MMRRGLRALAVVALVSLASGCGGGQPHYRHADGKRLPLVAGAQVLGSSDIPPTDAKSSDAYELLMVVAGPRPLDAARLKSAEGRELAAAGWRPGPRDFPFELGYVSPDRQLSVDFATPHDGRHVSYYVPPEIEPFVRAARRAHRPTLIVSLTPR
jgi:hypothetical protein